MTIKTKVSLIALAAAVGVGVLSLVYSRKESPRFPSPFREEARTSAETDAKRLAELDAKRLAVESGKADEVAKSGVGPDGKIQASLGYGTLKGQAPTTPQQKAAVEAFQTKSHPEYLSCAVAAPAFDRNKWMNDPAYRAEYLRVPGPSRAYQSAPAGKDVQRIALMVPAYIETLQGQPVELRVKGSPGFPVTFTSFDAAHFTAGSGEGVVGSLLTTQTVVAGADGIATAVLVAPEGVIDDCRVIASCPVDSGLAKITVHVKLPTLKAPTASAASLSNP